MKITPAHLAYWRERRSNPSWASLIPKPKVPWFSRREGFTVDVHDLINAQGPKPSKSQHDMSNMLAVLRMARRNERHTPGSFMQCLCSYAAPTYSTTSRRQAATARKWLSRIRKELT